VHRKDDLKKAQTLIGKGAGFKSWFKHPESENFWFWPMNGFQNGNTVLVYLAALRRTGSGGQWGFESTGQDYWAKIRLPELKEIEYLRLPRFNGITFGHGFVKEGEYVYAFGGKQKGLGSEVFVARFKVENVERNW